MKNKITSLLLSAVLLLAFLALGVSATEANVIKLANTPEGAVFEITEYALKEESKAYIDEMFDGVIYDASVYGAYKASLTDADGLGIAFTEDMNVIVNIGDDRYNTEIFVFSIDETTGVASAIVASERDGADLIIKGEDFATISGDIIVVMTSNKNLMAGPEYTIVPAVICACVAVVAVVVSVLVVKKKLSKEVITN
jgi:hypothetical protein